MNNAQQLYTSVMGDSAGLMESAGNSSDLLDEVATLVTQTQENTMLANTTAFEAEAALSNRLSLVNASVALRNLCQEEMDVAHNSMMQLRQQLMLAKTASAMV